MATTIFTLNFDPPIGEPISMQYHPESISMSDRSGAQNIAGLNNTITYIPPRNTANSTISVVSYFTAIIPNIDAGLGAGEPVQTDLIAGGVATSLVSALQVGGRIALDTLDAAAATISLAKGVYDIASGVISPVRLNPSPVGVAADQLTKITKLYDAMDRSVPCEVIWDVVTNIKPGTKYIITEIGTSVGRINEETGASTVIKLNMTLIKHGTRVEVI